MTPDFWTFAIGLAAGLTIGWLARLEVVAVLRRELTDSRKAEAIATDRLVHAWKEGAQIPPRPPEPQPPLQPLPAELQAEIEQWDDPAHRAELEAEIRGMQARGWGAEHILMELDNKHPR